MSKIAKSKYAPIALFVYNRLEHTKHTINALLKNPQAKYSKLFVYSDAAKTKDDVRYVSNVRSYLKSINGFAEVHIVLRKANMGLANSIIDGVTYLCQKYGSVIVLEDDIETSPHFLSFMNNALCKFSENATVSSISGYMFPVHNATNDGVFFRAIPLSWGWATWNESWCHFNPNGENLLAQLQTSKRCLKFSFSGPLPLLRMLKGQISGKNNSWFVRWAASLFLKGKLTVMPTRSLVKNIGIDGSGTHCASWRFNPYDVLLDNREVSVEEIESNECQKIERKLMLYFLKIRFLRYVNFFYRILRG